MNTCLGVEVVHECDSVLDISAVQCLSDVHTTLNAVEVIRWRQLGLGTEVLGRRLVPFDDEIVEDKAVQVTERSWSALRGMTQKHEWMDRSGIICKSFSHQRIQRDSHF
jgi:hypothetical protein